MQWDVRLLSASYRATGDELTIELYGKTRDGCSITVLHTGFEPYFHLVEPDSAVLDRLEKDDNVRRVESRQLLYDGKVRPVAVVYVKFPWLVPGFRKELRSRFTILAADIPFHHRFLYDLDMGSCIRVTGEAETGAYTTDLVVRMRTRTDFENVEPFSPQLKIMAFDIENSIRNSHLYTICYAVKDTGEIRCGPPIVGTEEEIIRQFSQAITDEDPDVITGYNIDNYDIPYVMDRAKEAGVGDLPWGRDGSGPRQVMKRYWRLRGRLVADAWWWAKRELRPKQETLDAVSKLVLGEGKMDVDPRRIDQEWENDRELVMSYCSKDAELSLRILEEIGILRKSMDLAAVSKLPLEDVMTSGSSQLIDSVLIREADRENIAIPLTGAYTRNEQIEGGYVHTISPGLYHWVCILDFKSMYPSLIIAKNICFTTLDPNGEIEAPTGTRFMSKDRREGLLPRILERMMAERDLAKESMRLAQDEEEKRYYDGLQSAIKILMNSIYGVFASSFYRFTDKSIGSAITAFARDSVKGIIASLQAEGQTIVYSDTDSVFIQSPVPELQASIDFGNAMAERFSQEGAMLEFEKLMEPLFSHGKKKRYVGKVVWPKNELLIRGYEVRRTDAFDLQSDVLRQVFVHILAERYDDALALARETVQQVLDGNVPVENLVISRSVREFSAYKDPDRQVNVQAARKLMELGYEFIPGMKVSWVVTDASKVPQEVVPWISGRAFDAEPDWRYYAERLAQTVARVTEVYGWDERSLMTGAQQTTLFDTSFSVSNPQRSKAKKADSKDNSRLEDFF